MGNDRRGPHPLACFTEPVTLHQALEEHEFSLTYIKATADPSSTPAFWAAAENAATHTRWQYHEIPANHMVQHNAPDALAEVLLAVGNDLPS